MPSYVPWIASGGTWIDLVERGFPSLVVGGPRYPKGSGPPCSICAAVRDPSTESDREVLCVVPSACSALMDHSACVGMFQNSHLMGDARRRYSGNREEIGKRAKNTIPIESVMARMRT